MAGYGTDEGFTAWLTENGYTLPAGAPSPAVLRQRGSTTIDALYGSRFVGHPTQGAAQERQWPRIGAYALGAYLVPDAVPDAVVKASYHAAFAALGSSPSGLITNPSQAKRVKVGDVETEFATSQASFTGSDDVPVTILDGLLAPFLVGDSNFMIRSVGA